MALFMCFLVVLPVAETASFSLLPSASIAGSVRWCVYGRLWWRGPVFTLSHLPSTSHLVSSYLAFDVPDGLFCCVVQTLWQVHWCESAFECSWTADTATNHASL